MRLPILLRRLLYTVLAGSWLTGMTFFVLSRFVEVEGEFGPEKHPWQSPILAAHGAFAFLMLLAIGSLWLNHVPSSWRSGRSRSLGITLIVVTALMVISGWVLYYAAGETLRPLIGNMHFALGLLLPAAVATHIVLGRRSRRHAVARTASQHRKNHAVSSFTPAAEQSGTSNDPG
ncbi:MAG: hypothetical protein ACOY82_01880 [Pseudomonadota bacterium]